MTDHDPDDRADEARPDGPEAEDAEIRGLLADLRVSEPMPGEVVRRLDDVLAGLVADRAAPAETASAPAQRPASAPPERGGAEVVALARRRQRRRTALVAAAVVALGVAGVGSLRLADGLGSSSGSASSADSAAGSGGGSSADSGAEASGTDAGAGSPAPLAAEAPPGVRAPRRGERAPAPAADSLKADVSPVVPLDGAGAVAGVGGDLPIVRGSRFARDAAVALRTSPLAPAGARRLDATTALRVGAYVCTPAVAPSPGTAYTLVRLDGRLALLTGDTAAGGGRTLSAWSCSAGPSDLLAPGGPTPLRTVEEAG